MEFVVVWIICGIICAVIAGNKGRSSGGFFMVGLILGPLGILLTAFSAKNEKVLDTQRLIQGVSKKCPMCAELIKSEAVKCRYCGADVSNVQNTAAVAKSVVIQGDLSKKAAICSCGQNFFYRNSQSGRQMLCPGCQALLDLP